MLVEWVDLQPLLPAQRAWISKGKICRRYLSQGEVGLDPTYFPGDWTPLRSSYFVQSSSDRTRLTSRSTRHTSLLVYSECTTDGKLLGSPIHGPKLGVAARPSFEKVASWCPVLEVLAPSKPDLTDKVPPGRKAVRGG